MMSEFDAMQEVLRDLESIEVKLLELCHKYTLQELTDLRDGLFHLMRHHPIPSDK